MAKLQMDEDSEIIIQAKKHTAPPKKETMSTINKIQIE